MTWSAMRDAMQAAVVAASGLQGDHVVWKNQDANQPTLGYIALHISPTSSPGQDGLVASYVGGADPLVDVQLAVVGLREILLSAEIFTASTADSSDALALGEQIRSRLRLPSVRALLAAQAISVLEVLGLQYVPEIVAVGFRGRAMLDVRCLAPAQAATDLIGYFNTISGTLTTKDGGMGTAVVPYGAP